MLNKLAISAPALLYIIFAIFISGLSSCHDASSKKNEVTIKIEKPQNNQTVENPLNTEILIHFSAPDIIHRFTINIVPSASPDIIVFDHDQLLHKTQISFLDTVDLSAFPGGTQFTLKVTACGDHDCNQNYETIGAFSI